MTIREKFAVLEGLKMCYIGDGNNMANSLIVGGLKTGMKVSIATPVDYRPDAEVMAFAEPNPNFFITDDPMKAAENADVVITDTWASMGQEAEKEVRMKAFQGYQVNDELLAAWCSTACRPTVSRRSPPRCSRSTQTKFSRKQKTACTHRRPLWLL